MLRVDRSIWDLIKSPSWLWLMIAGAVMWAACLYLAWLAWR